MTTDPNDLIESDKEEQGHQKNNANQGHKNTYYNPPSLPSTIKSHESKQQPCSIINSRAEQYNGHEHDGNF